MTRTFARYDRDNAIFRQSEIDAALVEGRAKEYNTAIGPIVVLKIDGVSIKVTENMIIEDDDNAAEAWLAAQDSLVDTVYSVPAADAATIAAADAQGISVGEYTDGEYRDPRPPSRIARFDAVLADFL